MHNIKLIIAYDGKNYLGWQKTQMGPSIEMSLQQTIEQILQHPSPLQAASRTDAGVHAEGQVVNFFTDHDHLDLQKFQVSLNQLLPKDIVIINAKQMPSTFHPTIDCKGKEYRYYICQGATQLPKHRFYAWHVRHSLNLKLINQAIPYFIGRRIFASFCNVKKNAHYQSYEREVQEIELINEEEAALCFRIKGNHFLYKMVRNMVGTLVDIGRGKLEIDTLPMIFNSNKRSLAGVTAPAHGLFLHEVFY